MFYEVVSGGEGAGFLEEKSRSSLPDFKTMGTSGSPRWAMTSWENTRTKSEN